MKDILVEGDRYGCFEVLNRRQEDVAERWEGRGRKVWFYDLRCDCGKQISVARGQWKMHMRDCGCGLNRGKGITTNMSISMKVEMRERLEKYAIKHGKTVSGSAVYLITWALKAEEVLGGLEDWENES